MCRSHATVAARKNVTVVSISCHSGATVRVLSSQICGGSHWSRTIYIYIYIYIEREREMHLIWHMRVPLIFALCGTNTYGERECATHITISLSPYDFVTYINI